jgi:hypothetical protein
MTTFTGFADSDAKFWKGLAKKTAPLVELLAFATA